MYKPKITIYEEKSKSRNRSSLILIMNLPGGKKKKSALNLYCATIPKNQLEKKDREEKFLIAAQIVNERERALLRGMYDLPEQYKTMHDFFAFTAEYVEKLKGVLVENKKYNAALRKFKTFLVIDKYAYYSNDELPCQYLTESLLKRWVKYMESIHIGETSKGYLSRMKILIRAATAESYFRTDPSVNVSARKIGSVTKDALTVEEIRNLFSTPLLEHEEVKAAFLFACNTGLRFCDVKNLKWANIVGDTLRFIQKKTSNQLDLPLKPETLALLGERKNADEKVFSLQSHTSVNMWIKRWAKSAGITKHVTFHCGRHSLASNLIAHNVDLVTTSKILGHISVKETQKYVKVSELLKKEALNRLSFTI
jgi:integrase/recombinase XerD